MMKKILLTINVVILLLSMASALTITFNSPTHPVSYHEKGTNLVLNFSISGTTLSGCYYEYNGYNVSVTCGVSENYSMQIGSLEDNDIATTAQVGEKFTPNGNIWIAGINKSTGDDATNGFIQTTAGINLSTCTFSGDYCEFSSAVSVNGSGTYYALTNGNGANVNHKRKDGGASYPVVTTWVNYTTSVNNFVEDAGNFNSINAMNVSNIEPNNQNPAEFEGNINASDYDNKTVIVYGEDSGTPGSDLYSWNYTLWVNEYANNNSISDLAYELFTANVSWDTNAYTDIAGTFYYNGTAKTTTESGTGENTLFSSSFVIPSITVSSSQNYYWHFLLTNATATINLNSTVRQVGVNVTNLTLCGGAPQNIQYLNFTFKNETTAEENINATVDSSWTYWIDDSSINKTYTYVSSSELGTYTFCFNPPYRKINVALTFDYNNDESQQKTYALSNGLLTNTTTATVLYLLPTDLGLFARFKTIDGNGDTVTGVRGAVSRTLNGATIDITSAYTDSSGLVTFFLNPDVTYDFSFTKTGYDTNSFSLRPTSAETYNVIMGGTTGGQTSNGTVITRSLNYTISPSQSHLDNETSYTFSFYVQSSDITFISMNITNATGGQLLYKSQNSDGTIAQNYNTGNLTKIIGYFVIQTDTESISYQRIWDVGDFYEGDYSFYTQMSFFDDYDFRDSIRLILTLGFLFAIMIYLSTTEQIETSESKIAVMLLLVWVLSIVGWLDTGLVVSSDNTNINNIGAYSSQYGIAIISTAAGLFFILRRVFIRRI